MFLILKGKKVNVNYIWAYFIIFFVLWSIRELWLIEYLDLMAPLSKAITSAFVKITIWVIPVILLVQLIEKRNPVSYLGLRHNFSKGLKWAGWFSLALVTYLVVLYLVILNKPFNINTGFNEWLNTIILVGIIEEIVFRGFLLRKFMEKFKFWKANTITSLLFLSIHFPIWFYKGLFELPYILSSMITAFVLGIIFGFIYKKTDSLWSVIVIHSLYNLLISIFN